MKIVYMGTPEFAVAPLDNLINSEHDVAAAVCQPDKKSGRGKKLLPPPVKVRAESSGIKVLQPEKIRDNHEFLAEISEIAPDIIVVAAYGKILPPEILNLPRFGCINIHASLLPKLRGAAPIQMAILNGDERTGITIMRMEEGLDTGDIIDAAEIKIGEMNYPELSNALSQLGGEVLIKVLDKINENGRVDSTPQNESEATYAGMISKSDGEIIFDKHSSSDIMNMIRAYEPWPGVYTFLDGEVLKIKKIQPVPGSSNYSDNDYPIEVKENYKSMPPGTILGVDSENHAVNPAGIYVKLGNEIIKITELQPQGKRSMDVSSYLRGHSINVGTVLGE